MPENHKFLPEGLRAPVSLTLPALQTAREEKSILEGDVLRCDSSRSLYVDLGSCQGVIPREEALAPWISGADREIALLSRVGKAVCFCVTDVRSDAKGAPEVMLSRRAAQEQALAYFLEHLHPGSILTARVTHLEPFGAFLDIGCGIIAMLPIEHISVARIPHPNARFRVGQKILAVISEFDRDIPRFTMTHKELLGTWMENASHFHVGDTVPGLVRSVREYGAFVELLPNLSGLADSREGVCEGDRVCVYIKGIRPERMKIKLQIIEQLEMPPELAPLHYQITDGTLERWVYSPNNYERAAVETVFTPCP